MKNKLDPKTMDPAFRRVLAMSLIIVLGTVGLLVYFDARFNEEPVRSSIDDVDFVIDDISDTALNVTIRFGMTIENYGEIRDKVISCSSIQNYLELKNSTTPLQPYVTGEFQSDRSYILNTTHTSSFCDDQPTEFRISENVIDNIVVAIPFRFVSGSYSFIWIHSFADQFDAAVITIDPSLGNDGVSVVLENPFEDD